MSNRIQIKKGLDIPVSGEPEQSIYPGENIRHVALCGIDYPGLKSKLLVAIGDEVSLGQALFVDKRDPVVQYCSPGQGKIVAINRGARRSLQSIVIQLEENNTLNSSYSKRENEEIKKLGRDNIAAILRKSGLWTAFRTRPYNRVPLSHTSPQAIFVNAIDTRPLAADPQIIIKTELAAFTSGLLAISQLTSGTTHLCTNINWSPELPKIKNVKRTEFFGPHPAGLPGTHIHLLHSADLNRTVWHLSYQDVIAIGKLLTTGVIHPERVIALGGAPLDKPRLVLSRIGASTDEILQNEKLNSENYRVISGCVLSGRQASGDLRYLGRYHNQISLLETNEQKKYFSVSSIKQKLFGKNHSWTFTPSRHGRYTGMVPIELFDSVVPLDILPSPLFRALMVKDTDQAQALGCLELDEEDLALCSFVCPAKYDYGNILRINLEQIEKEG